MIRYATVGTSWITENFIKACRLDGRFSLAAVYSRDKSRGEAFARKFSCDRVYDDLSALAEDKNIDAVYIASPNVCHFEQSKLMLSAGKHVICEKPAVICPSQLEKLIALSSAVGKIYIEAVPSVYSGGRAAVKSGLSQIGNIACARIDFCQFSSRYPALLAGELPNIFNMSLHAGTLMDLGVYCVYAAIDLFGKPKNIISHANFLPCGADGSGAAIFSYDGFDSSLTYSKTGGSALGSEICGDQGTLKIERISQYNGVSLVKSGAEHILFGTQSKPENMRGEAAAFADFIEGKRLGELKENLSLALCVCSAMDEIKKSCGIEYL